MAEMTTKAEMLTEIDRTYEELEELIAPLGEEQMTRPEVNGPWSVKDNLAHLSVWLRYLQNQLEGVISGKKPEDFEPGLNRNFSEDEENMYFYQKNKDRPLLEVMAEFRANHALVKETLLSMSEETLNQPPPWDGPGGYPLISLVAGNTFSHYEEHGGNIRRWLEHSLRS